MLTLAPVVYLSACLIDGQPAQGDCPDGFVMDSGGLCLETDSGDAGDTGDTGADSGNDSGSDTAIDTDTDTDSGGDTATDTGTDTGPDTGTDTGSGATLVCASGGDFTSITDAINAASDGDSIEVCPGTYTECLVIDKPITLMATGAVEDTIIEPGRAECAVDIQAYGEVTLRSLTFANGVGEVGGALYATDTDLIVEDCVFRDSVTAAVTIRIEEGSLSMSDSEVIDTEAATAPGLWTYDVDVHLENTVFARNVATGSMGDALYFGAGDVELFNVLVTEAETEGGSIVSTSADSLFIVNSVFDGASAVYVMFSDSSHGSTYTLENSVVYGNGARVGLGFGASPTLEYSIVYDTDYPLCIASSCADLPATNGNLTSDPRFTDPDAGDWTLDSFSPCIDAGNPAAAYNDPDGSRNDIGIYGGPGGSW